MKELTQRGDKDICVVLFKKQALSALKHMPVLREQVRHSVGDRKMWEKTVEGQKETMRVEKVTSVRQQ